MPKNRRNATQVNADTRTIIVKALVGSAVGIVVFFAITAIMSAIAWKNDMSTSAFKYMVLAAGAVSGILCGFVSVRPTRKNGIIVGGLSALPSYFIIILISSFISRAGLNAIGWILLAVMVVTASIGGILAVNKRK